MRLRKATLLILLISISALAGILTLASEYIVGAGFDEIETHYGKRNLERAAKLVQSEVNGINNLVVDWATWDETYEFVVDRNEEYIEENIIIETFLEQKLNFIGVFDHEGEPVYALGADLESEEIAPPPEGLLAKMEPGRILSLNLESENVEPVKGLLLLEGGPFLVAVHPVRKSDGSGPPLGMLVMGKFVSQDMIDLLGDNLGLPASWYRPDRALPVAAQELVGSPAHTRLVFSGHDVALGYVEIEDLYGAPGLVIELTLDRDIHVQSHQTIRYFVVALVIATLLFSAAVMLFIERRVLSRIGKLTRQVRGVTKTPGADSRVHLNGRDELSELAQDINTMLDEIARAHSSLDRELNARRASETFLAQIFDAVKAGIMLIDPVDFTVQDANSFALELMGRSREDIIGKKCHGFVCPAEAGRCPVVDLGNTVDLSVRQLIAEGGRAIPILKSVSRVQRNGNELLLETFIDITEIQEAEDALKLSEEMYRAIFRNTGTASIIVDMAGMVTMVNEEFERLAGIEAAGVKLRYFWTDFFPQEDQRALLAMQRNADELQESQHAKLTFNTAAGEERFVRILVAKLPRVNVCVISILDLTEQQQTETALRTIQQELEETVSSRTKELRDAVEELKEMDKLKSAFLSSASHELRTPLTSVLGYAKLIKKTLRRHFWPIARRKEALAPVVNELEHNFEVIEREGDRLTQIIDDLLDLNSIESGSMAWRDEVFDPVEVLDEAARNIQPAIQKKDIVELSTTYSRSLGFVRMDRARLHQVLINLLDNAVKFTHQGTVALRASNQEAGWVEIRVEDSGMGIAKEELESIFDKFYQTQSMDGLSNKPLGTGLGLTICRRIVERYHGRIWVESEPGKGSTFIVRLPMTEENGKPLRKKRGES